MGYSARKICPPGDVVTVTRIDRLARSTFDLFAIVKQIVDAKGQFRYWRSRGPGPPPVPGSVEDTPESHSQPG